MDIQHALLSKIILGEDLQSAVDAKVTPEWFTDERYQRIYAYCLKHWRRHGVAPDEAVIKRSYPSYSWDPHSQPIGYYIEQLRDRRQRSLMIDGLTKASEFVQGTDPDSVENMRETLRSTLLQVQQETGVSSDRDFSTTAHERAIAYFDERLLNQGYLRGISTGFKGIDRVTGGLQAEQFVVILGLPKSLKSSTLLAMAKAAHQQARRPLFLGFEMSNEEQEQRLWSLYGHVGLNKILHGTISKPEMDRLLAAIKLLSDGIPFVLSTDIENGTTVSGVQAKILEYKPDVVFIDACYLMMSEIPKIEQQSAAALTDIGRSLKKLAQAMKIPIVATTAATITRSRGGKLNMYSGMYTQVWQQSADVLLGTERITESDEDDALQDHGAVSVKFKVLASRSGPRGETTIVWDWPNGDVTEMDPTLFSRSAAMAAANGDDDD